MRTKAERAPRPAERARKTRLRLSFAPLTPDRWADLEQLFGPRGACAGCWCMYWRLPRSAFAAGKGDGNRKAFQRIVGSGTCPGILAYAGDEPVGWCAIEPREAYGGLARSRILAPVDDRPVWSVTCFYVAKGYRRSGVTAALLKEAVRFAAEHGAQVVEGYPVDPKSAHVADVFAWTGFASAFRAAGFAEVMRRSPGRPIMRYEISRRAVHGRPGARRSSRTSDRDSRAGEV